LVSDEEATEILNTSDENLPTIFVLNKLRVLAWKIGGQKQRDFLYQQLNVHIDTLTGAWGACERINNTPLPQVYVAHLRTFLLLYLLLWQMEAAATYSWIAIPTVFAASWGLLGIEAAAVECECPFKYHSNHLPLGKMCVVTARNVAQTIRNTIQIP
jgi:putative membrane protein